MLEKYGIVIQRQSNETENPKKIKSFHESLNKDSPDKIF